MPHKRTLLRVFLTPIILCSLVSFSISSYFVFRRALLANIEEGLNDTLAYNNIVSLVSASSAHVEDVERMILSLAISEHISDIFILNHLGERVIYSSKIKFNGRQTSTQLMKELLRDDPSLRVKHFYDTSEGHFVSIAKVHLYGQGDPFSYQWVIVRIQSKPYIDNAIMLALFNVGEIFLLISLFVGMLIILLKIKVMSPIYRLMTDLRERDSGKIESISKYGSIKEWDSMLGLLNDVFDGRDRQRIEIESNNEKLEHQNGFLSATMNATSMGNMIFHIEDDVILQVNDQFIQLWGLEDHRDILKSDDFGPLDVITLIMPKLVDSNLFAEHWASMQERKDQNHREFHVDLLDGRQFRFMIWPIYNDNHQYLADLLLTEDTSEKAKMFSDMEKAKDLALQASSAKGQFLANMSHEIRTPMNGIMGSARMLLDLELDSEGEELSKMIYDSTESLLVIINDILDYSKIEAGHFTLERLALSPASIGNDVLRLFASQAKDKCLDFHFTVDQSCAQCVYGDPTRIRQVLLNLVSNALKFTSEGRVDIRMNSEILSEGKIKLNIEVQDTGIGLTPTQAEKVFDSFTQADVSTSRKFGGTGLGTTISKKLVELMAGEMWLTSEPDVGTTFYFSLPMEIGDQRLLAPSQLRGDQLKRSYGKHLLLAEDNVINQKLAIKQLKKLGLTCDLAVNGFEAIQMAMKDDAAYDLILMDIQMPEMNGIEATEELRAAGYSLPIVAMTANVMSDDVALYKKVGMDGHIPKPFKLEELVMALDPFLKA